MGVDDERSKSTFEFEFLILDEIRYMSKSSLLMRYVNRVKAQNMNFI